MHLNIYSRHKKQMIFKDKNIRGVGVNFSYKIYKIIELFHSHINFLHFEGFFIISMNIYLNHTG